MGIYYTIVYYRWIYIHRHTYTNIYIPSTHVHTDESTKL